MGVPGVGADEAVVFELIGLGREDAGFEVGGLDFDEVAEGGGAGV